MLSFKNRKAETQRRHNRIRRKVKGSTERPRLAIYRSNQHIYAQVIDDVEHRTICSASTMEDGIKSEVKHGNTVEAATVVGRVVAERAKEKGVEAVVYDRGGNLYHGRVAALAEAAREAGLAF